jgi:CRP/FNR family transcriptional regulator, anaerobic regulatory protein
MHAKEFGSIQPCDCIACPVRYLSVCRADDFRQLAELAQISRIASFSRGETIIAQDEELFFVGNIIQGFVKMTNMTTDGRQQIVGLLHDGDFVGRIFTSKARFAYEATSDVRLCMINRAAFERLLSKHPTIFRQLLIDVSRQAEEVQEWLTLFNFRTTMQRLVGFIIVLAKREPYPTGRESMTKAGRFVDIPMSRRDLAAYLGTTPETLSRNIQQLARSKVIDIIHNSHWRILDPAVLQSLAGETSEELMAFRQKQA